MITKTIIKTFCLIACFAISVQSFSAVTIPGRQGFNQQMQGKTDAQAWDIVNAQKGNLGNYINAQDAYYMTFGKKYTSTRPAGGGTPAPTKGVTKPSAAAFTKSDKASWIAQAFSAIISATGPTQAADNLTNVIRMFKQQGYAQNDDYKATLEIITNLRDKIQTFITLPALPAGFNISEPETMTPEVGKALMSAKRALENAIRAAPDANTVNYMVQEFINTMDSAREDATAGAGMKHVPTKLKKGTTNPTEITAEDSAIWLEEASLAITKAATPAQAAGNLNNVINSFKQYGYPQNDNYKSIIGSLAQLRDAIRSFAPTAAGPKIARPETIFGDVQGKFANAKKALANAIEAATDTDTLNYMIQEFTNSMNVAAKAALSKLPSAPATATATTTAPGTLPPPLETTGQWAS